jgi:hypothetical protein
MGTNTHRSEGVRLGAEKLDVHRETLRVWQI